MSVVKRADASATEISITLRAPGGCVHVVVAKIDYHGNHPPD